MNAPATVSHNSNRKHSQLRQLALDYAEGRLDRPAYLKARNRFLDALGRRRPSWVIADDGAQHVGPIAEVTAGSARSPRWMLAGLAAVGGVLLLGSVAVWLVTDATDNTRQGGLADADVPEAAPPRSESVAAKPPPAPPVAPPAPPPTPLERLVDARATTIDRFLDGRNWGPIGIGARTQLINALDGLEPDAEAALRQHPAFRRLQRDYTEVLDAELEAGKQRTDMEPLIAFGTALHLEIPRMPEPLPMPAAPTLVSAEPNPQTPGNDIAVIDDVDAVADPAPDPEPVPEAPPEPIAMPEPPLDRVAAGDAAEQPPPPDLMADGAIDQEGLEAAQNTADTQEAAPTEPALQPTDLATTTANTSDASGQPTDFPQAQERASASGAGPEAGDPADDQQAATASAALENQVPQTSVAPAIEATEDEPATSPATAEPITRAADTSNEQSASEPPPEEPPAPAPTAPSPLELGIMSGSLRPPPAPAEPAPPPARRPVLARTASRDRCTEAAASARRATYNCQDTPGIELLVVPATEPFAVTRNSYNYDTLRKWCSRFDDPRCKPIDDQPPRAGAMAAAIAARLSLEHGHTYRPATPAELNDATRYDDTLATDSNSEIRFIRELSMPTETGRADAFNAWWQANHQ